MKTLPTQQCEGANPKIGERNGPSVERCIGQKEKKKEKKERKKKGY